MIHMLAPYQQRFFSSAGEHTTINNKLKRRLNAGFGKFSAGCPDTDQRFCRLRSGHPLGVMLARTTGQQNKLKRFTTLIIGAYFLECFAFTAGMCTQVFTFGLAAVWVLSSGCGGEAGRNPPKQ